jgi:hypothetical protein
VDGLDPFNKKEVNMENTMTPVATKYGFVPGSKYPVVVNNALSIWIPNILGQRYCSNQEILSALSARNGFDKGLYRPVFAIAVPKKIAKEWVDKQPAEDRARYDSAFTHDIHEYKDYAIFLFDGKHRGRQLLSVQQDIRTFPIALIYEVKSVEQGNWYFNQFNERSLTKVDSNAIEINDYFAGDKTVIHRAKRLKKVGLAICDKNDFMTLPLDAKKDVMIPSIGANPWKLLNSKDWHPDFEDVESAVEIYHEMLEESSDRNGEIQEANDDGKTLKRLAVNSWVLHGLAMLIRHRPTLLERPQPREAFVKTLATAYDEADGKQAEMLKNLKTQAVGPNGIGREAVDINSSQIYAVAMACRFNKKASKYGMRPRAVQDVTGISTLYDEINKDVEQRKLDKAKARMKVA